MKGRAASDGSSARATAAPDRRAPRVRLPYSRNLVCLIVLVTILVIVVTSALTLVYLRAQAEARVAVETQNLSKSLVLTFDGILDSIDVAILATADEIARQNATGKPDEAEITRFLVRQQQRLPVVPYLRATNAAGDIIHGAGLAAPYASVVGRAYFAALRDAPPAGLYVSTPSIGRISGQWIWLFARRISNTDGSFGGVVYAVLNLDQIQRVLATITLDRGGSIVLRHAGMQAITGRLGSKAPFPLPVGDTRLSPELVAARLRDPQRGTYTTSASALGSAAQTFSYERSDKYGFHVGVGEHTEVGLAEWYRQVWIICALTLAFGVLSFSFLLLIGRSWRRQQRDLAAIEQSQVSLREAHQIADIGCLTYEFAGGTWSSSDIFDDIAGIGPDYRRDLAHLLKLVGKKERAEVRQYMQSASVRHRPFDREQQIMRRSDGKRRWVHARGKICIDADQLKTLVCTFQDITERKQAESEIRRLAYYDVLTELPNRRLLLARLADTMTANAARGRNGALMLIDLDNFKILNDTQGHNRGDLLLRAVAARLQECVRSTDTVARLGGDEFVVLIEDLSGDAGQATVHAAAMGEKIRAALGEQFDLAGYLYASTPSVGITLFGGHEMTIDELTKRADTAMYQAKAAGRNAVRFFDPHMQAAVAARVALEDDLRLAIAEQQFSLHYQVQVDAHGRARGAEVLLRWHHPRRGMVSPAEFIPIAEQSGLILPIGQWVLATACAQLTAWSGDPLTGALTLAVNVSARQFNQPGFVDQMIDLLAASGADPRLLKLELTEGLLLEHTAAVIDTITALKRAGVGFSLDDFGTGYSSLSYLKRLPLDQLKIDQSFVRDLLTDPNDAAIVRTIVALGHSLGMAVIAEGVETAAQRDFLASAGCHAYQGYFFGRPVPLALFEQALRERAPADACCLA
ncbi:MAG: EAL domain-containing protein [Pseudomonadota bacterium]|nr:EAL domain-containing protein [Pseudomonadota bacterium]